MKPTLFTFLFIFASHFIQAQTNVYQPYPLDNASWTIYTQLYNGQTYIQEWHTKNWSGDTIINGQTYTRVFDDPNMIGVRQDIPNEKVYFIDAQNVEHDASFDQGVQVGDTVQITPEFRALNMFAGGYSGTSIDDVTIQAIDSILLGATYHKTLTLLGANITSLYDLVYICGVGCTNATTSISSAFDIDCYYVDGYQLIGNPFNPNCTASSEELVKQSINVYPNPTSGFFFIDCDQCSELEEIHILDLGGARIAEFDVNEINNGFDLSAFPTGMYFVEIIFEQGSYRTTIVH